MYILVDVGQTLGFLVVYNRHELELNLRLTDDCRFKSCRQIHKI